MSKLKKITTVLFVVLIVVVALSGCGGKNDIVEIDLDETLSVENLEISITRAMVLDYICGAYDSDKYTFDNGNSFLYVELAVKNTGNATFSFGSSSCNYMLEIENPFVKNDRWKPYFSENLSLLKRIPKWMNIRLSDETGYYNNVIFAHSNEENNYVLAGEQRVFMTAFQTPNKNLNNNQKLFISKRESTFKHNEIACIAINFDGDCYEKQ